MKKYPLMAAVIFTILLLTLGSLTNVMGYQTIQTSQKNLFNESGVQKEILFQTIIDLVNNKEIQQIILKSNMNRGVFPTPEMPVLTKNQLRWMYFFGLLLSKSISQSRIQTIMKQKPSITSEMQTEIINVVQKDSILSVEITQLQNSECDCGNEYPTQWNFPVICSFLAPLALIVMILYLFSIFLSFGGINVVFLVTFFGAIWEGISNIAHQLNCYWTYP